MMKRYAQFSNSSRHSSHASLAMILVAALAAGSVGCASNSTAAVNNRDMDGEAVELYAQERPAVPDLPVPTVFELIEEQSRSYEARGVRFVDHFYQGRAGKTELERFYQKHLPARGWEFQSAQMVRGTHTLRFEKEGEVLDVTISDDDRPFRDAYSRLKLAIHPVGASVDTPPDF